jgi:hypothetical protein
MKPEGLMPSFVFSRKSPDSSGSDPNYQTIAHRVGTYKDRAIDARQVATEFMMSARARRAAKHCQMKRLLAT